MKYVLDSITCKPQYISSWPEDMKKELQGIANVELIRTPEVRPFVQTRIYSPMEKYSVLTDEDFGEWTAGKFTEVYIVGEGGHLVIRGGYSEDKSLGYFVGITGHEVFDQDSYAQMFERVELFLKLLALETQEEIEEEIEQAKTGRTRLVVSIILLIVVLALMYVLIKNVM